MSEWIEYKLGECVTVLNGYAFKSSDFKNTQLKDFLPVIKIKNVANGDVTLNDVQYHHYSEEYNNYVLSKGDILIALTGNHSEAKTQVVGGVSLYKLNKKALLNQRVAKIIPHTNIVNEKYLYYLMKEDNFHMNIASKASGSASQANISKKDIEEMVILLPSLTKQDEIASILSSLDDKIDLLNRENATLEAMAETLFRQWFIEEAKEEWEEKPLSSIATFLNGLACQKYPPKNEIDKLPVLKIRELTNGIGVDSDWATTDVGEEFIVHSGDVIFAWSASLMVKIWDGEDCILNQHLFKVTSITYPKWFYYLWCKHHLNEFVAIAQSHATTMGHIKRNDLDTATVLVPSDEELKALNKTMESLFSKIEINNYQLISLRTNRDILLPKLMSNEINL